MKETKYLDIINKTLADASLIGDDCAFLSYEFLGKSGLYITQDSLIEDVHFSLSTISAYELGNKSVQVNLSDLAAMCAKPLCITISLSLPKFINEDFVQDFYRGVNDACLKSGVKVAGGDLTGSDKIFISVTAIGSKTAKHDISRAYAKDGDMVVVTGFHGDSAGGFELLQSGICAPKSLISAHLSPIAQLNKSKILADFCNSNFAMMDTSDGLADALYKIAKNSEVKIEVDFSKIPVSEELKTLYPDTFKNLVLWGGEDYQLLCCINVDFYEKIKKYGFYKIGYVKTLTNTDSLVVIKDDENEFFINEDVFNKKSFNHFGD